MNSTIFFSAFFAGALFMIVHGYIDYLIHRHNKLCYNCGRPYKKEVKK